MRNFLPRLVEIRTYGFSAIVRIRPEKIHPNVTDFGRAELERLDCGDP